MASVQRIKRRLTGLSGAPSGLKNAELAYNEVDDILYYGKGISAGDDAAAVIGIGGPGLFGSYVTTGTTQTITGDKTFSGLVNVGTVAAADNSIKAASTAWVRGYAQPLTAALTAFAAMAATGLLVQTAAGAYTSRAITGTSGRITVADGNGVAGNPVLDLATTGVTAGTYPKVTVDVYGRVTAGSALVSGDVTTALGFTPENVANKGVANGYAGLDGTGKVPTAQLPASVIGGLNYQGTWNASTNTPTLANGVGTKGFYYKVTTAGNTTIDGDNNWTVGDLIVFNGTEWDKIEGGTSDVVSVAGKVGVVTLVPADVVGLGTIATQNANAVNLTGGTIAGLTSFGIRNAGTGAFDMIEAHNGTLTAARTLTWNLNDVSRSINLSGNLTVSAVATVSGTNTGDQTITLTGDVTGGGTGSFATTLATVNASPQTDTLRKITVNAKGLTTATSAVVAADINGVFGSQAAASFYASPTGAAGAPAFRTLAVGDLPTSIPLANLAAQASNTFIGNSTGGSAAPTAISAATAKTMLSITTADISGLAAIASSGSAADLTAGTIPAARMPALTGDVTSTAGTVATTLGNGVVTLAKMANLAANSFIGNNTGSAATPIALTSAQAKALLAIANTDVSGLGTMSVQNASAVNITGGTIDNVVLDGGTF